MFSDNFGEFPRRATGALRGCGRFFSPSTREAAAAAAAAAAGEFNRLPTVCAQVPKKKSHGGGGGGSCTTPSIVHRNGRAGEEHTSTHKLLSHLFLFPSPPFSFQNAHIRDNIHQLKLCFVNDRDILPPIYLHYLHCTAHV